VLEGQEEEKQPQPIKEGHWEEDEVRERPSIKQLLEEHDAAQYIPPSAKPSFFERIPIWRNSSGRTSSARSGIAILVLAIGFFVKYAIDN